MNIVYVYIQVNQLHGLSPGKNTKKRCDTLDIRRRRKAERAVTTEKKRRRIQLKVQHYVCYYASASSHIPMF